MRIDDPPGGEGNGGVGAITFDKDGNMLLYDMILEGSTWNCGGGKTPVRPVLDTVVANSHVIYGVEMNPVIC